MPENLLTDLKIRSAKSTDRDWKLSDGGGLFLLVKPTGGKLWRWKYRLQGKENLFAIGGFPQVSLAEARAAREKARALVKQGIHPAHGRQVAHVESNKVRATYNKALLLDQRRALLQDWADYLSAVEGGGTA